MHLWRQQLSVNDCHWLQDRINGSKKTGNYPGPGKGTHYVRIVVHSHSIYYNCHIYVVNRCSLYETADPSTPHVKKLGQQNPT
jgi:hypothetical protein